jgi:hypothetical protein
MCPYKGKFLAHGIRRIGQVVMIQWFLRNSDISRGWRDKRAAWPYDIEGIVD